MPQTAEKTEELAGVHLGVEDGIAVVRLVGEDGKPFILTEAAIEQLEGVLADLGSAEGVRGMVLTSDHPTTFCAGADIDAFISIADDPEQAREISRRGQELFDGIAALPFPTVAAVHGTCVGGGLELAMACDARIVSDEPETKLGLPEVQLGILPAWGGTTRLPMIVGLRAALPMLLTGASARAFKVVRIGLAKDRVPRPLLRRRALDEIESLRHAHAHGHHGVASPRKTGLLDYMIDNVGFVRNRILAAARKQVMAKTRGHYPAPLEILRVLGEGADVGFAERLVLERNALAGLIAGKVSRKLVSIFTRNRDKDRGAPYDIELPDDAKITRVAVVGGGVMGAGIATALLLKDKSVRVVDVFPEALAGTRTAVEKELRSRVKRRRMDRAEMNRTLCRLELSTDFRGLRAAELVIEAVPEVPEIKRDVLGRIAKHASKDAIVATNTSGLSVSEMAGIFGDRGRFAGLHFFNPVPKMPLVEIVRSEGVDQETLVRLIGFVRSIGKVPVVCADSPAFIVNRILGPYLFGAVDLLRSGARVEAIDSAMKGFGLPMGPFELMDTIGLDVVGHVAKNMADVPGVQITRQPVIERMVQRGQLGRKSGAGFYSWTTGRPKPYGFDDLGRGSASDGEHGTARTWSRSRLRDELLRLLRDEARKVLEERVVETADDLDLASIFGMGFPPYTGGIATWLREGGA